ncbi:hypothetical protein J437_LFUL012542 [Ladona fulva]|uniref:Programmed cell death protein 2 C-terminal domain-containing protein n=1 Tax=Ladona fulva TaxID=123851 RepID=A0A8K0KDG4_LADFU|nr:hypothetical protein J437_LFUL012542 [Ladona fulva]
MGVGGRILPQAEIAEAQSVEEDEDDEDEDEDVMDMEVGVHNLSVDDPNANSNALGGGGVEGGGAVGQLRSPVATAEIEVGDEGEVVCIDTPRAAQMDILALFAGASESTGHCDDDDDDEDEEVNERRQSRIDPGDFESYFLSVWPEDENETWMRKGDEDCSRYGGWNSVMARGTSEELGDEEEHIRQLLLEYRQNSGEDLPPACAGRLQKALMGCCWGEQPNMGAGAVGMKGGAMADEGSTGEKYERGMPAHGDRMFHRFLLRIKRHPGQLVRLMMEENFLFLGRYCRDAGPPLLLYPLGGQPQVSKCLHCRGDTMFELQILPSIIPKLRPAGMKSGGEDCRRPEFGTVLVFACASSCWGTGGDKWREERVVVQAELGP